ncbi:GPI-anchored protein LLG1-like [Rhodamnia argentea]|uniref:GPI-anchored protein LLG1-like n=1 Tax=Rhodamnia argentea TaxID=178133 RepID=A0A8B8QIH1_9MYRT|nr:GPI-anchored protein LLG1-like [Rhodamnia argentea]
MAPNPFSCGCLLFFLFIGLASSSFIHDGIFESREAGGRSLLQAKKSCSVDFENQNYTILTSQCKGPQYTAKLCCGAFKEFACPFVDQINDLTTDCASTMFSYINLYGKYPPGLFANECKEGKEGLDCSTVAPATAPPTDKESLHASGGMLVAKQSLSLMFLGGFVALLLQFF